MDVQELSRVDKPRPGYTRLFTDGGVLKSIDANGKVSVVINTPAAAVAVATGAGDVVAQFNALRASLIAANLLSA